MAAKLEEVDADLAAGGREGVESVEIDMRGYGGDDSIASC